MTALAIAEAAEASVDALDPPRPDARGREQQQNDADTSSAVIFARVQIAESLNRR
jgi:hypothetical protein